MSKPQTTLIKAEGIGIRLSGRDVLESVDIEVHSGEIVTLIGPNGAGKTTLVRILLGLLPPDRGRVICKPGLKIGYMPQRLSLPENLPLTVRRFLTLSASADSQQLDQLANELDISHLLMSPMQALSGGEHQRVLLTRALLRDPDLLVLDEPVQGVDVTGQNELYRLITGISEERSCGVLMISHDLHIVMATTDRVMCINRHVCCSGHPEAVSQHPAYLELFGAHASSKLAVYTHHHDHTHDIHGNVVESEKEHDHG
ncbi:MAG: zinc ABC transporter ATP-binding protein ZnuC [Candidatus Sedimenticola sp. (ex Thyasira tokunagai)]